MASSSAKTAAQYVKELPPDRRAELERVRDVVNANLPDGFVEGMSYGMICWYVPLSVFSDTYNGEPVGLAGLAAQKRYNALYLMTVYGDPATDRWFRAAYQASGKKLDMGKSCVRFEKADDLPLDLIGEVIARVTPAELVERVRAVKGSARKARAAAKPKRARSASGRRR